MLGTAAVTAEFPGASADGRGRTRSSAAVSADADVASTIVARPGSGARCTSQTTVIAIPTVTPPIARAVLRMESACQNNVGYG